MPTPEPHPVSPPPTLRTLGALSLPGAPITRPKPLLVLAYLAHEGPTDRDRLARLFFKGSRDPRDALATTLRRLRGLVAPAEATDARLQAMATTDALEFQRLAFTGEAHAAMARYRGSFLQGAPPLGDVEIDDWIVGRREHFASVARDLHVTLAREALLRERAGAAWHHAHRAIALTEAFALEPEPSVSVLDALGSAGLRVPEGWWRTVAALGHQPARTGRGTVVQHRRRRTAADHRRRAGGRGHGVRAAREAGLRRPRRRVERA